MTAQEVSKRYNIPLKILQEYESWGLCGAVKLAMEDWKYDHQDIERLGTIMALHDMGFAVSEVEAYMRLLLSRENTEKERIDMLQKKRSSTLHEIHFKEQQITRMDYLRMEIQKQKEKRS